MKRLERVLSRYRLQSVLIASFSLMAAFTIGLNTLAIDRVIRDYLSSAESERVSRDMDLANAFFQLKLDEVSAISHRLVLDYWVIQNFSDATLGQQEAKNIIDQQIKNKIIVLALGGTHLIAVLDIEGNLLAGRVLWSSGELSLSLTSGNWSELPIVKDTIGSGEAKAATEIIPSNLLAQVGLDGQALVMLVDTPKAAAEPFDPREGTGGLALVGVSPLEDGAGKVIGAVLSAYLINNDFTLVDRIKEVAGVDTVTVFFGDLRVSTNVMTESGQRAVGTRVSKEVYDVVLMQGQDYVGEAFVVNQTYITSYKPLRDHLGKVVGSLYVGVPKSSFQSLVDAFRNRVIVIALVCIILAGVIAVPIARFIVQPIVSLVRANQRLAGGDMTVRVPDYGNGELAVLGRSFNNMVETMRDTQEELVHKEKLASMGQLAAGVAHEVNNPLGTILLLSDVLYKELEPEDSRRADLRMIIDETTRCKTIVSDLLNFARQQEVLAEETDLHELLEGIIEVVQHKPVYEGIEIVCQFSEQVGTIQADPNQLKQVFINLFDNAAEAIEESGVICVATQLKDSNWVEIKVSDTGRGIPEENLGRLFTPFFTTKELGKGTGLGLSIVYGIIKMHHGQISVQSVTGKGTTFTIDLPVSLPENRQTRYN